MRLPKWFLGMLAVALLMGLTARANAADTQGRIKNVNADKATFVMTDENGKDWTFKAGDGIQVHRNDKAVTLRDLQEGDEVRITYAKDNNTLVASNIKVTAVATANTETRGKIKSINPDKNEFVLSDKEGNDWRFRMSDKAKVQVGNNKAGTLQDLKVGEAVLVTYKKTGDSLLASEVRSDKGDKNEKKDRRDQ
jgi:hypothetical protein